MTIPAQIEKNKQYKPGLRKIAGLV